MLTLVVQVEDYIYIGTSDLAFEFEKVFHSKFQIGSLESGSCYIMGAKLSQDFSGSITLNAKEKLSTTTEIKTPPRLQEKGDRDDTPAKIVSCRIIGGRLLYIGRLTSPVIGFYASDAATKCKALKPHHLWTLDQSIKYFSNFKTEILYSKGSANTFRVETMSNASMGEVKQSKNVRERIIVLRKSGNTVNAVGWSSNLARRVLHSTCTAELLAAADAVGKLTFPNHVLKELSTDQLT